MVQSARDLPARVVWFLTVRVAEVGVLVLLVGAMIDARSAWLVGAQYSTDGSLGATATEVPFMRRVVGMALFGGYRLPISLLVIALTMAAVLVVLHRCQPVSHTRVLRWEWLTLWAAATLVALLSTAVCAAALVADDPFASTDPTAGIADGNGPGFREQMVGTLSWPLGALLLLIPLALWWARLPDMDDLEDALAELEGQRLDGVTRGGSPALGTSIARIAPAEHGAGTELGVPSASASEGGTRSGRIRRAGGARWARPGRAADQDAIFVDDVEQIEPVERLRPRGDDRSDGSSTSGYDGYFGR